MTDPYPLLIRVCRLILRAFFRRVEVTGSEHIPSEVGGVVVSWHPNGLIDPALILTHFPHRIVFGARHGLFKVPGLGALMRALGTVPIYRAQDMGRATQNERRTSNQKSLDALARAVASGSFSALFPEGVSHDDPHLQALKPGVARLYYQTRAALPRGTRAPVLIPAGLHYDDKHVFRSSALVQFHPPLVLPKELDVTPEPEEDLELARVRNEALMKLIGATLHDVVGVTEDWRLHQLIHRARKLIRAERASRAGLQPGRPLMQERALGFARVRMGYLHRLESHPREVEAVRRRVEEYDADLRTLGIEDHELDADPRWASPWLAVLIALQLIGVFFLLPPVVLVGYLVNLPTAGLLLLLSRRFSGKLKDEATVKLLGGIVLFPLTWALAGTLSIWANDWVSGFTALPREPVWAFTWVFVLGALGGAVALRYLRLAREAARSARVRFTRRLRRRAIVRLREERAALFEALIELGEGLELPGAVSHDGRVL